MANTIFSGGAFVFVPPKNQIKPGTFSLFPTIIDGEWESTFDAISLDVDSSTISGASSLGQPIEAGSYSLLRFQFPPSVEGSGFCILDSSKFWNADQSVSYEFEGPGCTVLSVPEAIMEFTKPREVDGEIEVGLRMELTKELFGFEVCVSTGIRICTYVYECVCVRARVLVSNLWLCRWSLRAQPMETWAPTLS